MTTVIQRLRGLLAKCLSLILITVGFRSEGLTRSGDRARISVPQRISEIQKTISSAAGGQKNSQLDEMQWGNWGNWGNWANWANWNQWNQWANWNNWNNWG